MPEIKKPDKVQVHLVRAYCSRSILNVPSVVPFQYDSSSPPALCIKLTHGYVKEMLVSVSINYVAVDGSSVPCQGCFYSFLNDFRRKDLCSFAVSRQGVNSSGSNSTTSLPFMLRSGLVFQHNLYCRWTCLNTRPDPNSLDPNSLLLR